MNDMPTVERSLAELLASPTPYVDAAFASGNTGTFTTPVNTAGAGTIPLGDGKTLRVVPAGPTNYGHIDILFVESATGEVGRGRVTFLIPVSFA